MSETEIGRTRFEGSQPILRVEDMKRAVQFYVGRLGFANASWGGNEFTSVNRDQAGIYLCLKGQGLGQAWVWVGVEDVVKLRKEIVARGVTLLMEPKNFPWAKEIHVEDPDGNVIRFGSEPDAE
ncbi:MAG TPA: glyoxalase superfamily protein [Candidatus Limnocylindrales bacterium]|nr:glyoxalase superfamily protein [Candidatus Limnocylindrales bacterium]